MIAIQTKLDNELLVLTPIQASDFEKLYEVAADRLIREQHPSWDRYKKEVFQDFFKGVLKSKGGKYNTFMWGVSNIRSQKAVLKPGAVQTVVRDNSYIYSLQQQAYS